MRNLDIRPTGTLRAGRRRSYARLAGLALLLALLPALALAATRALHAQQPLNPAGDAERVRNAGKIVFGTAADYPPFEFYNSNQELDGFDIALAKALGEALGVEVEFNDYAFDGLLSEVQLGQVDAAIAALSVTPDRQQVVDFSNLYYIGDSAALVRASFPTTVTSPTDLGGMKVGVQRGTTYQAWAQQTLVDTGLIGQVDLVMYGAPGEIIRDLRTGKIDVGLMGALPAELAARNGDLKVTGTGFNAQQFAIAVPKGSSLALPLNDALIKLQSDGTFAELAKNYLRVRQQDVIPTGDEAVVENAPAAAVTPAAPACLHSMAWVADLNLDDQNMKAPPVLLPGQDFTKGWRVRNSGTCAWPADFELAYTGGNRIESSMGGSSIKVGRAVAPGETVDLSVALRAPQTYGTFQGFWKMRDDLGQSFGEVIWVGIQVPDPNPPPAPTPLPLPTPVPQPTPAPQQPQPPAATGPNLRADSAYINAGQCTTVRWEVDNVNSVYFIDGGNQQGVGGHDARPVCPGNTATYVLRVVGQDGVTRDYPITITVSGNAGYSINFWGDDGTIDAGRCTHLRWDVRNVQAVYLNGEGVAGVSDREVCPGSTQTWTLEAVKYDGGRDSRQVTVNVNNAPAQKPPPFIERLSVSSNVTFVGECIGIEWRTNDADRVNLTRDWNVIQQNGPGNGYTEDCNAPAGLHEYELVASNEGGQAQQTITVSVEDAGD